MSQPLLAQPAVRPLVVAPSYNNAGTLDAVIEQLLQLKLDVLVVNDGSTDGTAELLARRVTTDMSRRFHTLSHPINRGKAAALCTGFEWAVEHGYTHAATIDTDGQLNPDDLLSLLELSATDPTAMVVGIRDADAPDYPRASRFGRRFSNTLIWMESGLTIADSQCGLRVYPLHLLPRLNCCSGHFGFETEVLTRLGWINGHVLTAPVSCRYTFDQPAISPSEPGRPRPERSGTPDRVRASDVTGLA